MYGRCMNKVFGVTVVIKITVTGSIMIYALDSTLEGSKIFTMDVLFCEYSFFVGGKRVQM